uniref:Site-specific integrase n=1 Tax=Fervidobacterium nodosum TaxID=2424 RepID=A0A7C5U4I5_9BACT
MEVMENFPELEKFKEYLNKKKISPATRSNYIETLKSFYRFTKGEVTQESVKRWIDFVRSNYKITAWRQYFVPLRAILQRFYPDVYAHLIEELKVPYKKTEQEIITYLDFWKIFKEAEKIAQRGNDKYVIVVGLAALCGLKSGDIVAIKGTHIKNGKVSLENYPLPFEIPQILRKYLKKYEGKDEYIVATEDGSPIKPSYLAIMLRTIQKRLDINLKKPLSVEMLRNIGISRYLLSQPSIPMVMNQFSYSSIKSVEDIARYLEESGDIRAILSVKVVSSISDVVNFFDKLALPVRKLEDFVVVSRTIYVDKKSSLSKVDIVVVVRELNDWYAYLRTIDLSPKWSKDNDNMFVITIDSLKIGFVEYDY